MGQAVAFEALTKGVAALQSHLLRLGYDTDEFRLLIPAKLGAQVEAELMGLDPQDWRLATPGIEVHADGHLKQITLYDSIKVGWKLGRFKEKAQPKGEKAQRP